MNTYALTKTGKLLLFDNLRLVDRFTEINVSVLHQGQRRGHATSANSEILKIEPSFFSYTH